MRAVSTTEGRRINGRLYPDMIGPVTQAFGELISTVSVQGELDGGRVHSLACKLSGRSPPALLA